MSILIWCYIVKCFEKLLEREWERERGVGFWLICGFFFLRDGYMKVDFKILVIDKLMNEEMEKIK